MNLKTMGIGQIVPLLSGTTRGPGHQEYLGTLRLIPANWGTAAPVSSGLQCKVCFQGGRHTSQATAGLEVTHGPAATQATATICVSVCCSTELANTLAVQV